MNRKVITDEMMNSLREEQAKRGIRKCDYCKEYELILKTDGQALEICYKCCGITLREACELLGLKKSDLDVRKNMSGVRTFKDRMRKLSYRKKKVIDPTAGEVYNHTEGDGDNDTQK